jgi:hypothetical protein
MASPGDTIGASGRKGRNLVQILSLWQQDLNQVV